MWPSYVLWMTNPEVLCGEITAALDPEMVHEVAGSYGASRAVMTMLVVTHDTLAQAVADRVILIDQGYIVLSSDAQEFSRHPKTERAQEFWYLEFERHK